MPRVAAIDCGTNSIRLLVAELTHRHDGSVDLRDLHREMRIVRLGQAVDATGRLAPEALERTRAALVDYTIAARRKGVERVRMVATSATRDAANRDEFFAMTREVLGVDAEVISGDEEARLSFTGAVGEQDPDDGPFLVVDVGGGSTELVLGSWDGREADVHAARSVDIGCVRITERTLRSDPPGPAEVDAARELARQVLAEAFDAVDVSKARTWIGVAGTVTTLSAVAMELPGYDSTRTHLSRLSKADIDSVAERLLTVDHATRAANPVIHPGRVDVIGGGAVIVRVLAEELVRRGGPADLVVSEHDILDGIALSLA
ncbi:exopolyphosphatase / guanosine-5'-triphosphate,3'-diphosphate pyrophosphatase [Amycolatopsis arida]|uniref:Exopolyphosphatase / guanosine-5'-triphosphate,3'-diphosphate pyrophosphatase n=1 Tax=Amycolatopsis arida TaxID=587909 RepID=A0A1I5PZ33_9PSEU|nr:Ppx/GppA phosphatase family protein [Amycolatopsis arida]TDX98656.1 exopolyphosphatase/guanosine-5'-triphosphate,3'-diphosphate pyrophosphatase [Amycolatopsis arida]SFP39179.1 exopolyphosphatase / guanosine-5'-triphosphate,3'-diphosphate pyrophosphatase [Amycolatopsis arida]